jgi:hypothetical protein
VAPHCDCAASESLASPSAPAVPAGTRRKAIGAWGGPGTLSVNTPSLAHCQEVVSAAGSVAGSSLPRARSPRSGHHHG